MLKNQKRTVMKYKVLNLKINNVSRKKLDVLMMDLRKKEDSLHELEEFNQKLITKERKSDYELQYARKKLISIIKEISTKDDHIGVKKMAKFNAKPFIDAMKKRYNKDEAEILGAKLYSLWEENIKDPNWNPFKVVFVDGVAKQVIINDEDEKLNMLKRRIVGIVEPEKESRWAFDVKE
ncbi:hypothetical protein TSUD_122470 [Trifolium subterraneum]|nr:hypothetical protein TSUD_122470 [Trifolium subterraneum]